MALQGFLKKDFFQQSFSLEHYAISAETSKVETYHIVKYPI